MADMDYSSSASASSALSSFRPSAPTTEIPIIYLTTHGVFDVETDDNQIEEDKLNLGLAIPIPEDMTILKYNFVPINVCNYGGSGTIGQKNIPNHIHQLIIMQLDPKTIMARYGFEYFLSGDPETLAFISNFFIEKNLENDLEKYRGHKFIDVPEIYHEVLYDIAILKGLRKETILDLIMNELTDCKVNDTGESDSRLTGIERESIMRGKNVMDGNTMMMKIIHECVKKGVKDIKAEINQYLVKTHKTLEDLRKTHLYPNLIGIPYIFESQKPIFDKFEKKPEVRELMQGIDNVNAYLNHVDDLAKSSYWNISIPSMRIKPRYILNKIFSLQQENEPDGMDWNITMFNPKTGTIKDIFGLNPENKIPETLRKMSLKQILKYLERKGMKTLILIDQTCSVFREFTPDLRRLNVKGNMERKWANTVRKLNEGDTIYGGKRKKHKTKKRKTQKRKKRK